MRTAASSDALRGAIGRARRTDPPSGGLSHVWSRFLAGCNAAPYNLHGPVRTPDELPTVRALGRAAAAALLLPAVLRRAGQGRRADTTKEFESVSRVADVLSRTGDVEGAARALLDELAELFDLGFAALTFVSDDARHASGYLARAGGEDVDWWRDVRLELDREPSGIASAVFEATALTVYDTASSGVVSRRLADAVGAKSAAFVPLLVEERVTAVISVATLDEPRVFSSEDLAVMQTLAAEAAVALERLRAGRRARGGPEARTRSSSRSRPPCSGRRTCSAASSTCRSSSSVSPTSSRSSSTPTRPTATSSTASAASSAASRCTASTRRCSPSSSRWTRAWPARPCARGGR